MTDFFKDESVNRALHNMVHHSYARKAGLMSHEFMIHFDEGLNHNGSIVDVIISAGTVVHIGLRCLPDHQRFPQLLREAFGQDLRPFIRRMALVRAEQANKWRTLAIKLAEVSPKKKRRRGINFVQENISMVKLTDIRTKRIVIVEVTNGDMFTAGEIAYRQLYGSDE